MTAFWMCELEPTDAFNRNQIGLGAASAMMMLMTVVAIIVPLIYSETRRHRRG